MTMSYILAWYEFDKLKTIMRNLYHSNKSEHGNTVFEVLSELGRISNRKGTDMLYTLTDHAYAKLEEVMRDLFDSGQSEHGDAIHKILSKLGRVSTGKLMK